MLLLAWVKYLWRQKRVIAWTLKARGLFRALISATELALFPLKPFIINTTRKKRGLWYDIISLGFSYSPAGYEMIKSVEKWPRKLRRGEMKRVERTTDRGVAPEWLGQTSPFWAPACYLWNYQVSKSTNTEASLGCGARSTRQGKFIFTYLHLFSH